MKRVYELVLILDPELKAEEQKKLLEKVKKFISDAEGEISNSNELGKKDLAYPIKKSRTGVFYMFDLTAPAEKVPSLKQKIQLEEKILRYLLTVDERRPD